ncbi:sulfatase [Niabella ginsenosidivorans]|nr:sulfatase [Niabella ginsenosidivorans]
MKTVENIERKQKKVRSLLKWKIAILCQALTCMAFAQGVVQTLHRHRPNIVFILADDLGWMDITPYGSTFYETPNLSRLAKEGMRFTNAYAASPVCSPTRASIMTGKHPVSMGLTDYIGAPDPQKILDNPKLRARYPFLPAPSVSKMPLGEITIAEALKKANYTTFIAGKWHLGDSAAYWPEHQGFDINKGGNSMGHPNLNAKKRYNGYFSPYGNPRLDDGPDGEYLPLRLAEETTRFIEANKEQPFFVYLSFYSVHTPLQTTKELERKYTDKKEKLKLDDRFENQGELKVRANQSNVIYAGMVDAMDQAIGRVLDKLTELKLDKNTLIIFFSDNGGLSTSEGHPTSNAPLRTGKGWLYEGGIREPLIVKWPGIIKPNTINTTPVMSTDFYPTLLQAANLSLMPQQHTGGISILPLFKGGIIAPRSLFWHYPHFSPQGGTPSSAVQEKGWKLIHSYVGDKYELYNLEKDISEKINLADRYPRKVSALKSQLFGWLKQQGALYPTPFPAN